MSTALAAAYATAMALVLSGIVHAIAHVERERATCERDKSVCAIRIETLAAGGKP